MATLLPVAGGGAQKLEHVNRACESCRLLKVRCIPSPDIFSTRCTRCTKTGRNCQYAAPQKRRPRKRTDTRVAELEREVKAMRSLLSKTGHSPPGPKTTSKNVGETLSRKTSTTSHNGSEHVGGTRSSTSVSSPDKAKQRSETPPTSHNSECFFKDKNDKSGPYIGGDEKDEYHELDVIDRGIISLDRATELFNYFVNEQIPQAPLVTFRQDETFDVIRAQKPIVFQTLLTAASGLFDGKLYSALHEETMHVFAEHYIINCGEKSLEMVQAFLLTALWLYPPDDFRKLKFYQYSHMAASMMLDIGPAEAIPLEAEDPKEGKGDGGLAGLYDDAAFEDTCYPLAPSPLKEPTEMKNEPLVVESRRTYLSCYMLCSNVSLSLRRPCMLSYSPFVAACISFLKRSPCASKTDRQLAAWGEMQHIADECAAAFSLENASLHEMSDARLALTLKGFETRLEDWWKDLEPDLINPNLTLHYHQTRIFIQEFAIMVKQNSAPVIPQPRLVDAIYSNTKQVFSAARANAILVVVESAHALLDVVIGIDTKTLRAMPVVNYARTVLAVILLIKMCATINAPNSELAKIIDFDSLQVDYYVKGIVEKLQSISEYRVASKFLPIIIKVAMWYYQNTDTTKNPGQKDLIAPLLGLFVEEKRHLGTMGRSLQPFGRSNSPVLGRTAEAIEASDKTKSAAKKQHPKRLPDALRFETDGTVPVTNFVTDIFTAHNLGPFETKIAGISSSDTPKSDTSQTTSTSQPQNQYPAPPPSSQRGGMVNQLPLPSIAEQAPIVEGMDWFHPPAEGGGLFGGGEMDIDIFALTEEAMQYGELDMMNQWFPTMNEPGMFGDVGQPQQQQQQSPQPGQSGSWQWS